MTNTHLCALIQDYFDGLMNSKDRKTMDSHLERCSACRAELDRMTQLTDALRNLPDGRISDAADLQIRSRVHARIPSEHPTPEILDLDGVARLLGVSVRDTAAMADELPGFELNGTLRFRREAVLEWIQVREKNLLRARDSSRDRQNRKIYFFPGG